MAPQIHFGAEQEEPDAGVASALAGTRRGTKTIEEIYADNLKRFPEPIRGGPLAVDILRADRDSR